MSLMRLFPLYRLFYKFKSSNSVQNFHVDVETLAIAPLGGNLPASIHSLSTKSSSAFLFCFISCSAYSLFKWAKCFVYHFKISQINDRLMFFVYDTLHNLYERFSYRYDTCDAKLFFKFSYRLCSINHIAHAFFRVGRSFWFTCLFYISVV